jgi:outer membrane receptor protein involved in Fe transport
MEYELADGRFLRVSAGRTSQGQRADELQVADGETSFHPVQKADQWVLGYEQLLADHGAWRVEAYRKRIHDPAPRYENLLNPVSLIPEMEIDRRRIAPDGALAYGVEFAGRYTLDESWSGFLNYAWSEVEDDIGTSDVPRNWNQQHALLLGLLWRSGPWSLSGQGSWRTGWSRTEFQIGDSGALLPVVGERNRARWPAQWNLDIRASWRKPLKIGLLEIALDVNNATNRSNPCCTDLRMAPTGLETRTQSWLPRYLNVGVVWNLP